LQLVEQTSDEQQAVDGPDQNFSEAS